MNDPDEISWGNALDQREGRLLHISLLDPKDPKSREKGYWAAALAQLLRDGWALAYSDGSGRNSQVGAGAHIANAHRADPKYGAFLGDLASVADGERKGLALALAHAPRSQKICVLSDSTTAIHTALQLSGGAPPRSGIEAEIRHHLLSRQADTAVAWIRGHIGLEGNTIADNLAGLHAYLGAVALQPRVGTHEGIKAASRANRKQARTLPGFGTRRTDWHRHALSAYTWYRTGKGPQKSWLAHIRKIDDPICPCGHPSQTGEHIVFHCPLHDTMRKRFLGARTTWEELDSPVWR